MGQEKELRSLSVLLARLKDPLTVGELAEEIGRDKAAVVAAIDTEAAAQVIGATKQLSLSEAVTTDVLFRLAALIEFERYERDAIKTTRERRAELERVAELSHELARLLSAMELRDSVGLMGMGHEVVRPLPNYYKGRWKPIPENFQMEVLAAAAVRLRDEIPSGSKGGRRSLLSAYAKEIARVWEAVEPSGLQPGRGGDFEYLCDALFQAAGVQAKAEGAIRYFRKHLYGKPKNKMVPMMTRLESSASLEETPRKGRRKNPQEKS